MDIKDFLKRHAFALAAWILGGLVLLLLVFKAGFAVGFRKAYFTCSWGENYHRNFAGPRGGFVPGFPDIEESLESHGVFGKILKVDGSTLVIDGEGGLERVVEVATGTLVREPAHAIEASSLTVDQYVVVIGEPREDGVIEAKLIRVMPDPSKQMPYNKTYPMMRGMLR